MEIKAELNYLHIAPRKVRLVVGLVRGMSVKDAELALAHLLKRSAGPMLKLLHSAVADAKHDFALNDTGGLYVKEVRVDQGPVLKRMMPRAFGRGALIKKRMCHVRLILETGKEIKPRAIVKKAGPMVRDVTLEDIKEGGVTLKKEVREVEAPAPKRRKPADFVRRMFRRKAI